MNGHGKTELVGHIAIAAMSQEVRTCIASLELKPGKMLARLTRQTICTASPKREEIIMTNEWFSDRLWVFKLTGTAKPGACWKSSPMPAGVMGIDLFVIDTWRNVVSTRRTTGAKKEFIDTCATSKTSITAMSCLSPTARKTNEAAPTGKWTSKALAH
ncbi:Uncharacterised protein [Klebsiella pneumoniae]|uniref:Uncharacterized protein n=1 Tax=Klebsiella pneumoniae TaxID=573 RepID=A0A2X3CSK2_KLEPN|nr:Uncharacterised protein [Klebsiella pneumoniae]